MRNLVEQTDRQLAAAAVGIWANYIETGDVALSAHDAQRCGKEINALSLDQMKLIV